jgi:hypothetical protein
VFVFSLRSESLNFLEGAAWIHSCNLGIAFIAELLTIVALIWLSVVQRNRCCCLIFFKFFFLLSIHFGVVVCMLYMMMLLVFMC